MEIIIFCIIVWALWQYYKVEYKNPPRLQKVYGNSGENIVACELGKLNDNYHVKHDVRYGRAQIDHMVIYGKTIFVVETKRWSGKVCGKKNDEKWKVEYKYDEHWYKNPVLQNEFHIRELQKEYRGYEFVNIVVFVNSRSIPRLKGVMRDSELYDYIVQYESKAS